MFGDRAVARACAQPCTFHTHAAACGFGCGSQYWALNSGQMWPSIDAWREEEIKLNIQGRNFSNTIPFNERCQPDLVHLSAVGRSDVPV